MANDNRAYDYYYDNLDDIEIFADSSSAVEEEYFTETPAVKREKKNLKRRTTKTASPDKGKHRSSRVEEYDDDDEYAHSVRKEKNVTIGELILGVGRHYRNLAASYTRIKPTDEEAAETKASLKTSAVIVAVCTVLLAVVGVFVHLNTELYTLSVDIASIQNDIEEGVNEQIRIDTALASQGTIDKVEEYAESTLGMIKAADHKINYIDFSGEDSVVVCGGNVCVNEASAGN